MAPPIHAPELLREYLADRDAPCPVCRYNLRGLTSTECTECGSRIEFRVMLVNARLAPWLTALVSIAMPLGFYALVLLFTLIFYLIRGRMLSGDMVGTAVFLAMLQAVVLGLWIVFRGSIMTLVPKSQWTISGVVTVVSLIIFFIFFGESM